MKDRAIMHPYRHVPSLEVPGALQAPADPILALERELEAALQFARRQQRRALAAERELRHARRELGRRDSKTREQLRAMRAQLLAMERRCWAQDEVCRALLLTIERAACSELDEQPLAAEGSP